MSEEKKAETFAVKDRRRFVVDESGEAQPNGETAKEPEAPQPQSGERESRAQEPTRKETSSRQQVPLPEIDFSTFILSLSSNALLHLGLIRGLEGGQTERNLPLAKQMIDLIVMLRDKTKGNLLPEESNLIENLLTDLRLKYVNEIGK